MKPICGALAGAVLLLSLASGRDDDSETGVRAQLMAQTQAWNAGDIPAFLQTYADDCIFVGKKITVGKTALRQRYETAYPSRAAMGTLTFSNLKIRLLDNTVAVVTGEWHLERSATAGGPVGGLFSLVWRLRSGRWEIVLDHTS